MRPGEIGNPSTARSGAAGKDTPATANGPEAAAACFRAFELEFDYVYRALLRQGVSPSDAEDLVQDVFVVTWRRWSDFDTRRPLRPWLAGIAFKIGNDHLKRRRRWEPRAWLDMPDQAPGGEELLAATRARELAARSLAALEERQRSLIVLHDLDGVPMREIAAMLSVPLFTAYSRLRAARRAFSSVVDRELRGRLPRGQARGEIGTSLLRARGDHAPTVVPSELRRRSLARLRGWLLVPGGAAGSSLPGQTPAPLPLGTTSSRWLSVGLGGGLMVALLAGVVTLVRDADASRSASDDTSLAKVARPAPGIGSPGALAARPPAFRTVPTPAAPAVVADATTPTRDRPRKTVADRLRRGLVGYWRFDEASAAGQVNDLSGNDNHCAITRAKRARAHGGERRPPAIDWIDGIAGRAAELDGSAFLTCTRPEPLARLGTELTVSLWVKPGPPTAHRQVLIARQLDTKRERSFAIALRDGSIELISHAWQAVTRRPLPVGAGGGAWMHLLAVHRDNGRTLLYLDGVMIGRSNRSRRVHLGGGSSLLTVGGSIEGLDPLDGRSLFTGAIDEVVIHNRALGRSEVEALAARVPPAVPEPRPPGDNKIASIHQ